MSSNLALDSHVRLANFESMQQTFFYETGAVGASRLVRPYGSSRRLDQLLRHHTTGEVNNLAEVHLRDLFDDLFSFFSLVEIGSQVAAVPNPLPITFQTVALRVLKNPACRAYYVERYPLPLPQALVQRLDPDNKSQVALAESGPIDVAIRIFQDLLAFELLFRSDDEIRAILRLLDGFTVGGEKLGSLVEFAKSVENYQAAVSSKESERGARGRALRGFGKLLASMLRLDTLLSDCELCPLLQSSIWHYYQYWIQRAAAERSLVTIISSWRNLQTSGNNDGETDALAGYLGQIEAAFQRLNSSHYQRVPILPKAVS